MNDLLNGIQSLLDQWLQQSEGVVQTLVDECQQGQLESMVKIGQILEVGQWLADEYTLEWDEDLGSWEEEALKCHNLSATYQASVITDGTASDGTKLHSDILLGAQADFSAMTANPGTPVSTELTVDYIEGFWSGICTPNSGTAELALDVDWVLPNLGSAFGNSLKSIKVYVKFVEQVDIDCSANRFEFSANAQAPFHGGALERLNKDRESAYGWEFEIEYKPGGGAAGHFEEANDKLTWPHGTYNLWQIITVCQGSC
jgi:hypothetical protein